MFMVLTIYVAVLTVVIFGSLYYKKFRKTANTILFKDSARNVNNNIHSFVGKNKISDTNKIRDAVLKRENKTDDAISIVNYTIGGAISKRLDTILNKTGDRVSTPRSVNYHYTRVCNYQCGFCFHTAKNSYLLDLENAKVGMEMLQKAGMEKINFSGGEPFMIERGNHLGEMVRYCKETLKLPSVSIVSNGSLIREKWFAQYGKYLDILAISCDSFNEDTNKTIGRGQGRKSHIEQLHRVKKWCDDYNILFKINTVVNIYNYDEIMIDEIEKLAPVRWKTFQCLLLDGENVGPDALRNAEQFYISDELFQQFIDNHKSVKCLVPESNVQMQNSYLILDEYMRFLDCTAGGKVPSKSILDVGVANALKFSGFDEVMFKKRGGVYKWSNEANKFNW